MSEKTKVLFCGTRHHHADFVPVVQKVLDQFKPEDTIIMSGAAPGIDTIAAREAKKRGFKVQLFPADWQRHGKAAGPIRNSLMIANGPKHVFCFPYPSLETSIGTLDTHNKAKAAKIDVVVVPLPKVLKTPVP
jgi:hypothetical protein